MEIDRILEIDMLTGRMPEVIVRTVALAPHRGGIVPHDPDTKMDLAVLTNALMGMILIAESNGTYKKGEAMRKVIDNLHAGYVDVGTSVAEVMMDDKGKFIKRENPGEEPGFKS